MKFILFAGLDLVNLPVTIFNHEEEYMYCLSSSPFCMYVVVSHYWQQSLHAGATHLGGCFSYNESLCVQKLCLSEGLTKNLCDA